MFILALHIGIYSYIIFTLGILGILTRSAVLTVTLFYFFFYSLLYKNQYIYLYKKCINLNFQKFPFFILLLVLLLLQIGINLIGAVSPELAFDALWYHLTLPKLYILHSSIYHIPGGLLYYSDMPKLGEMLYTSALILGNEIFAKLLHLLFGVFVSIALYKVSRFYTTPFIALVAVLIFNQNLVVAWESTTAYIDLIRTFYEFLALWAFLNWVRAEHIRWLLLSAVMIGLAITTKLLSLSSLIILTILVVVHLIKKKSRVFSMVKLIILYAVCSLLVPLPWFIFSYIHTGNPVYPFFSSLYAVNPMQFNVITMMVEIWKLFTQSADPLSPIYIILFPFVVIYYKKFSYQSKLLVIYSLLAIMLWYFTPRTGGGRFILTYLPVFSLVCAILLEGMRLQQIRYKVILVLIVILSIVTIGYRSIAEWRYLPYISGSENKSEFLIKNLNYSFGDFYDTDNYFRNNIKPNDRVLLYGFHNLFYVEFPFIHESWVQYGDTFTHIATQDTELPERFHDWHLVYQNSKTLVKLYKPPLSGSCKTLCEY